VIRPRTSWYIPGLLVVGGIYENPSKAANRAGSTRLGDLAPSKK
jgi:hypothetical protein